MYGLCVALFGNDLHFLNDLLMHMEQNQRLEGAKQPTAQNRNHYTTKRVLLCSMPSQSTCFQPFPKVQWMRITHLLSQL